MTKSMREPSDAKQRIPASHPEVLSLMRMARDILRAAKDQQWQHLGGMVANWRDALERFFANDLDVIKGMCKPDEIRQLNEINQQVIALVEEYRESLTTQLKGLRQGRNAVSAYSVNHTK